MPSTNPVLKARSNLALAVRSHGRDSTQALNAKRELVAAKLERDVERTLAHKPPPTSEQAHRIAAMLLADEARELVATWPALTAEQRDHVAAVLRTAGGAV
jgi:hypothetical protein